jgi:hypothetical protein
MEKESGLSRRTTVFDAKFCISRSDDYSLKMREEFDNNSFISFDELCEFAQTIKLTDDDKPHFDIIELSFLITNKHRQPLIMDRGTARALKKGVSVLFSFTPTQFGPNTAITDPRDLLPVLKKNYLLEGEKDPEITLIGVAHNCNRKVTGDGGIKEINYYFIAFEAHFPESETAPVRSREFDDVVMDHLDWGNRDSCLNQSVNESLKKKPVDRMILDHVYQISGNGPGEYQNARFIAETAEGSLAARLFHRYDIFVSHASEDKPFVTPLVDALERKHGLKVWYDNAVLKEGDRLREVIREGITASRYGVIVFSENFFRKRWPYIELENLIDLAHARRRNVIVPVWHGIRPGQFSRDFETEARKRIHEYCTPGCDPDRVLKLYRSLEDILGITECTDNPEAVAQAIAFRIKSDRRPV